MTRRLMILLVMVLAALVWEAPVVAVEPNEILKDASLELRAREISKSLRCLVCQNQSIDDSNASLARDLRVLVRERLVSGDSDEAAVAFIVSRYGDYVLLKPPIKAATYVLWLGPSLMGIIGLFAITVFFRRRKRQMEEVSNPLSSDEKRRLKHLLEDDSS